MITKWLLPIAIWIMGMVYIFISSAMIFKLIPMWLILVYAYKQHSHLKDRYLWLTLCGLFFCMLGDGLLQWFVIGLSAFLIGHLFYAAAFITRWRFSWRRGITLIPIIAYGILMATQLLPALVDRGDQGLIIPVIAYLFVISAMGWLAIMTGNRWAIVGGLLFIVSDSILAWNLFVSHITYSTLLIMGTYYSAQFLFARSIRSEQQPQVQIQSPARPSL